MRNARLLTFSAIDQQSEDAGFTEALTVTSLIVGRGIREIDVRELFGNDADAIPIFFGAEKGTSVSKIYFLKLSSKNLVADLSR